MPKFIKYSFFVLFSLLFLFVLPARVEAAVRAVLYNGKEDGSAEVRVVLSDFGRGESYKEFLLVVYKPDGTAVDWVPFDNPLFGDIAPDIKFDLGQSSGEFNLVIYHCEGSSCPKWRGTEKSDGPPAESRTWFDKNFTEGVHACKGGECPRISQSGFDGSTIFFQVRNLFDVAPCSGYFVGYKSTDYEKDNCDRKSERLYRVYFYSDNAFTKKINVEAETAEPGGKFKFSVYAPCGFCKDDKPYLIDTIELPYKKNGTNGTNGGDGSTPPQLNCAEICEKEGSACCKCVCDDKTCPETTDTLTNNVWTEVGCITATQSGITVAVMRVFVGIVTGLAVIRFVQAGFMLNTDDPEKIKEGKSIAVSALAAIVFGALIPILLYFIGVDILGIVWLAQFF